MKEKLEKIREDGLRDIENANSLSLLDEVRHNLTGKKSELSEILKEMGSLSLDMKKEIGWESEIITDEVGYAEISNVGCLDAG